MTRAPGYGASTGGVFKGLEMRGMKSMIQIIFGIKSEPDNRRSNTMSETEQREQMYLQWLESVYYEQAAAAIAA